MALKLQARHPADGDWQQLRSAIETGDLSQLKRILVDSSMIDFVDQHGVTPLLHAVCHNQRAVVQLLIQHGAEVNAVRSDGFTALLLATFYGHNDILHALVESGANVKVTTRFGTSARTWAIARGFYDIAQYLEQQQDKGKQKFVRPLKNDDQAPKGLNSHRNWSRVELKQARPGTNPGSIVTQSDSAEIIDIKSKTAERSPTPLSLRRLKSPPEIWDLVHATPTTFHPASAFLSRMTSAKPRTIMLTLAVSLILVVMFAGLDLRTQGKRSAMTELAAPPRGETNGSNEAEKTELNVNSMRSEQKSPVSPNENPLAEPTGSLHQLQLSESESSGTSSLLTSGRISRRPRSLAATPEDARVNDVTPVSEEVNKTQLPKTPETVGLTTETRVTENPLPVQKPAPSTTNSQLITRPFGSRVKPKTIQWP
jgi:Ankyrin repeat